jgi:hypothetical protein
MKCWTDLGGAIATERIHDDDLIYGLTDLATGLEHRLDTGANVQLFVVGQDKDGKHIREGNRGTN